MLDVLLVLLIVFMAISIRLHRTIDVQLPQACAASCEGGSPIVLEVLPGPEYRVNREPVARGALLRTLTDVYAARPEKILQFAGYPGVSYQDVVTSLDVARSAGVKVIGVAPKEGYLTR
jgi:biopolymer transport protein ExbD